MKPKVVIDNESGRGASLEYSPNGDTSWLTVSTHHNLAEANVAFAKLPYWKDRNPNHYRICVHEKDIGES